MTTTKTELPPMRPFTLGECEALVAAGIIAEGEQSAVLSGARLFNVDEYLEMEVAGILHEDDPIELMDGKIIVMGPIGDPHVFGTDWLTMILVPLFVGRAVVRIGGPIYLNDRSAPQPDVAVVRPYTSPSRSYPDEVYFVIEVADSSLSYDSGPKLARYAAAGIPEVWIANLRVQEVAVHTAPSGSEYGTVSTYRAGDSISPRAFPDVTLAVEEFMPPASQGRDAASSV
jgi:Uma2 family endonuclease